MVNDATSLTNGKVVALKLTDVTAHLEEVEITRYLSKDALRSDPDNHSVPLIEVLEPPDDRNSRIVVLPLLRPFDSPKFETKGEAIQFLDEFVTVSFSPSKSEPVSIYVRFRVSLFCTVIGLSMGAYPCFLTTLLTLILAQRYIDQQRDDGCERDVPRRFPSSRKG